MATCLTTALAEYTATALKTTIAVAPCLNADDTTMVTDDTVNFLYTVSGNGGYGNAAISGTYGGSQVSF
ncbi:MAG: hypothetical protein Q9M36_09545 [Sulfurovum sp.]|nr:hypothetical protein [Sulfurovum sp.]